MFVLGFMHHVFPVFMQAKLTALAAHARYSDLGGDAAWRCLALAHDVVALLAAARRHESAAGLQDLSSAYVDLLAERIVDAPAAVACFAPLCAALGELLQQLFAVRQSRQSGLRQHDGSRNQHFGKSCAVRRLWCKVFHARKPIHCLCGR